jgi:bacteriocin-like protein
MDPKAQDGNEAPADELTEEQLDQVSGGRGSPQINFVVE